MPSAAAFWVMRRAKLPSLPASASAITTAASLADLVTSAMIASSSEIVWPRFRPSREAGMRAARLETLSCRFASNWPFCKVSKAR
jgi:hypothetical protein